jgi:hypothetical protein
MASAEGTGFAVKFPSNGSDLPHLFMHRFHPQKMMPVRRAVERDFAAGQNI